MRKITLSPLTPADREQFISDNQKAFKYGAMEEFGLRDDHFEEDGEIISRKTIEDSIDGGIAYRILCDDKAVGGAVVKTDGKRGELELLFVSPEEHGKGIGKAAWRLIEEAYPEVRLWQTFTPYFETRNIHFYVNCCGFHIVEFYNTHHPDPNNPEHEPEQENDRFPDGFFRFEKRIPAENFYGASDAPGNVRALYRDLCRVWAKDTCAPRMRDSWDKRHKSYGQCSITAFLIQELFGGKVLGIRNEDGSYHCFNVIDGLCFDLTSEQFDKPLDYEDAVEQSRDAHFAKAEKKARYELLKARLLDLRRAEGGK